jgi:succinate dehydrogenase/fumarate reductase cytochrome b subunit
MFLKIDFSALSTQMTNTEVQADLDTKIKGAAEAAATGGLGLQGADAETVVNQLVSVKEAITNVCTSSFSQDNFLSQTIVCKDSGTAKFHYIEQELTADVVAKSITTQSSFSSAMLKLVSDIDANASAKATGYDPLGIILLLAVAVVVGIIAFALGGTFSGVNAAKRMLGSPYFWMTILGFVVAGCAVVLAGEGLGFWPKQKVDNVDSADSADKKKKINTAVSAVTGVVLTASLLGCGAIAYFALIKKK